MLKNIKDSLEISYKQGLESNDIIYIKGQIKDWEEMLSNIKHEQELKDNALKMYDEGQQEIERLNNIINNVYNYLDAKKYVPEWWDTDFMICMNILRGGTGNLIDILKGSDKE